MLGTENLERGIMLGVDFFNQTAEALEGGFQTIEIFKFIDELTRLPEVIKTKQEMIDELNDMDSTERQNIIQKIKDKLNVTPEDAEVKALAVIDWLFATYSGVKAFIKK